MKRNLRIRLTGENGADFQCNLVMETNEQLKYDDMNYAIVYLDDNDGSLLLETDQIGDDENDWTCVSAWDCNDIKSEDFVGKRFTIETL